MPPALNISARLGNAANQATPRASKRRSTAVPNPSPTRPNFVTSPATQAEFPPITSITSSGPSATSSDVAQTSHDSSLVLQALMRDQEAEVLRLKVQITSLQDELAARPTQEEVDSLRREWQTSEELFLGSQKDNEQKHAAIQGHRAYIKALETKLDEVAGPDWKDSVGAPSPFISTSFPASTPLPKPGARSSTMKRASRAARPMSVDLTRIRETEFGESSDSSTPAHALLKLEGKAGPASDCDASSAVSGTTGSVSEGRDIFANLSGGVRRPSPQQIVRNAGHGFTMNGARSVSPTRGGSVQGQVQQWERGSGGATERQSNLQAQALAQAQAAQAQVQALQQSVVDQLASLTSQIKTLPASLSTSVSTHIDTLGDRHASLSEDAAAARAALTTQLQEREATLGEREIALAARENSFVEREAELAAREAGIHERESRAADRDTAMGERDAQLGQREASVDETTRAMAAKTEALRESTRVLEELLTAAEGRARERELRLQGILAEAKMCSGHMEF